MPSRLLPLLAISLLPTVAWAAPSGLTVPAPEGPAPVEAAPEGSAVPAPEGVDAQPSVPAPDVQAPAHEGPDATPEAAPEAPAETAPETAPTLTPETAPVVVAPAPVVPVPAASSAIDRPPPYQLPPPRFRGTGLFVAAGLIGAVGAGFKLAGTIRAIHSVRTGDQCFVFGCGMSVLLGHSVVGTPLLIASAGLLGGGMGMRGHWRAHEELFGNTPRDRKPTGKMPLRTGLGWGLFGGGVGLWAVSRAVGVFACRSEACLVGSWEATYYLSGAAIAAGMVLGPYGSGYARYKRRYGALAPRTSVTPLVSPDFSGVAISGQF